MSIKIGHASIDERKPNTMKIGHLKELVEMSYNLECEGTDIDALFLEKGN